MAYVQVDLLAIKQQNIFTYILQAVYRIQCTSWWGALSREGLGAIQSNRAILMKVKLYFPTLSMQQKQNGDRYILWWGGQLQESLLCKGTIFPLLRDKAFSAEVSIWTCNIILLAHVSINSFYRIWYGKGVRISSPPTLPLLLPLPRT